MGLVGVWFQIPQCLAVLWFNFNILNAYFTIYMLQKRKVFIHFPITTFIVLGS